MNLIKTLIGIFLIFLVHFQVMAEEFPRQKAWQYIEQGALVVDVRTPTEFSEGHLDGALNIPHDQLAARLTELGTDKQRELVLYCRSGKRSQIALDIVKGAGFTTAINAGGYTELLAAKPD